MKNKIFRMLIAYLLTSFLSCFLPLFLIEVLKTKNPIVTDDFILVINAYFSCVFFLFYGYINVFYKFGTLSKRSRINLIEYGFLYTLGIYVSWFLILVMNVYNSLIHGMNRHDFTIYIFYFLFIGNIPLILESLQHVSPRDFADWCHIAGHYNAEKIIKFVISEIDLITVRYEIYFKDTLLSTQS